MTVHDLDDGRGRTGFDFVRRMAELDVWAPDMYIHGLNADGQERMLAFIRSEDERRGLALDREHPVAPGRPRGLCHDDHCWYCPERPSESIESEVDAA